MTKAVILLWQIRALVKSGLNKKDKNIFVCNIPLYIYSPMHNISFQIHFFLYYIQEIWLTICVGFNLFPFP